jgi:hypothetical protein
MEYGHLAQGPHPKHFLAKEEVTPLLPQVKWISRTVEIRFLISPITAMMEASTQFVSP